MSIMSTVYRDVYEMFTRHFSTQTGYMHFNKDQPFVNFLAHPRTFFNTIGRTRYVGGGAKGDSRLDKPIDGVPSCCCLSLRNSLLRSCSQALALAHAVHEALLSRHTLLVESDKHNLLDLRRDHAHSQLADGEISTLHV